MKYVMESLKFSNRVVFGARGKVGGLCMTWNIGCLVKKLEFNKHMIAIKVFDAMCEWTLVGF